MEPTHIDSHIARLARRQHGVFALRQVLDLGCSYRQIEDRRRKERIIELDKGVYAHPAHPPSWLRQVKAAELRHEGSGVSGRASVVLHDLAGVRPGAIEVTVARNGGRSSKLAVVRQRDGVRLTTVQGIRVVTVEQAIADLAGTGDESLVDIVVEDALIRGKVSMDRLVEQQQMMSQRRTRGAGLLGEVLRDRATGYVPPASEMERVLYQLMDEPGMPDYVAQSPFPWWPEALERVDVYVPVWRRIIEADGRLWHARMTDFERDKRRDHLAQANGIEVTRLTYDHLVRDPSYARRLLRSFEARRRAA